MAADLRETQENQGVSENRIDKFGFILNIRHFGQNVNNPKPSSKGTIWGSCRAKKQAAPDRNFELEIEPETVLELEFEPEILQSFTAICGDLAKKLLCLRCTGGSRFPHRPEFQVKTTLKPSRRRVQGGEESQRSEREMIFDAKHKKSSQAIQSLRRRWSCYPDSNWGPHPYQLIVEKWADTLILHGSQAFCL